MKKFFSLFLFSLVSLFLLFAQGKAETVSDKEIKSLTITFVPSADVEKIIVTTEPLKELLREELLKEGYSVNNVNIYVSTNYEAAGEALCSGTTDIAFIPAGTYVQYDDGARVILKALRHSESINSPDPRDWNNNEPIRESDNLTDSYRALIYSGLTDKAKKVADKVNRGEDLSWEELNDLTWAVSSPTSSAGFIYPSIWLYDRYGKTIEDLENVVQTFYASSFAGLSLGMYDIIVSYADARIEYEEEWTSSWKREKTIWEETDVIGVTEPIMNDTISVSTLSPIMTEDFISSLQRAFINIAATEKGKEVLKIYDHYGYIEAVSSDYDVTRKAQALFRD